MATIDRVELQGIGASPLRKEDWPLVRGEGCFVADFKRPGMVHAFVVRSPYAHASFTRVDREAAMRAPGVIDVITAADLPERGRPIPTRMFKDEGATRFLQKPLADGAVRYSGEPVALVVAATRYAAEDAAELVRVDYEPLDVVLDPDEAVAPGATLLQPDAGTNVAGHLVVARGDIEEAFARADLVVREEFRIQRHAAVPLETRGLLAEHDERTGVLTVWGAAKIPHVNKRILLHLLGWTDPDRVRLVELHVGGGFGARGEFYPEDFLIPFAAMRTGRPIAWIEDREENLRACNQSREQVHRAELALTKDGGFLGLRDTFLNNTGAYVRTHGMTVPGLSISMLPGPYLWPAYRGEYRSVVTNKTPGGTYRSPGRYEVNFVRERLIDIAAHRLGIDPVEIRRRNLIARDRFPYDTGTLFDGHPVVYDSGDYGLLLDKALETLDLEGMRRWRQDPRAALKRGVGVAYFVEKAGPAEREYARVELDSKGRVTVFSGTASVGQGVETVLAQVCATHLGLPYDRVKVVHGDTAAIPEGFGAFGSRAAMLGGAAVMKASIGMRDALLDAAAEELEVAREDLVLGADEVSVVGAPTRSVPLSRLVDVRGGVIKVEDRFECELLGFPYGLHFAAVEVDPESGAVHVRRYAIAYDIGRVINPMIVRGQITGGFAQGLGGALLEEFGYDASGQPLAASFMDYLLPTSQEIPRLEILVTEDAPSPINPLGVKGVGEAGTAAVGAAIANAVSDALGVEVTALPLKPQRVAELAGA